MARAVYGCTGCRPVDTSVIEAYLAIINTNAAVTAAEADRVTAEEGRVSAESGRVSAEEARVRAEDGRVDAESLRVSAEETRQENERVRQQGEENRNTQYAIAEGSASSTAGDGSRWGSYKSAEAERDAISAEDHRVALADHGTAGDDHTLAVADHGTAGEDHTAATSATARANAAAEAAEHMVDIKQGPKGDQGNTGSSVDYPYELVNNLTTNDATKGLSAAQGVVLAGEVSQLEAEMDDLSLEVNGSEGGREVIDYSQQTRFHYTINSNGFFIYNATNYNCVFIPVTPGQSFVVKTSVATYYDVLKEMPDTTSTATQQAKFATGYSGRITMEADVEYSFVVPNDGHYLWLYTSPADPVVYEVLQASPGIIEKINQSSFPILSFVGAGSTYVSGLVGNSVLLKGHNYRFCPFNFDLSDVSVSSSIAILNLSGKGSDGTAITLFRIDRGTGTFVVPEYIEYFAEQDVYELRFDGRNKSGQSGYLVIEDLGAIQFPQHLELTGRNEYYATGFPKITLYKGTYRCNIVQWDANNTYITAANNLIVIQGEDAEGNAVVIATVTLGQYNDGIKYFDFDLLETRYNVCVAGKANSGTVGIVTINNRQDISTDLSASIQESLLLKNITLEQGTYDATGTDWATSESDSPSRVRSNTMKADDVIINVPKGIYMMMHYGTPGQPITGSTQYFTGNVRISKSLGYVRFLFRRRTVSNLTPSDIGVVCVTPFPNVLTCETLNFPSLGCGNKMLSLPRTTYAHLPNIRETAKYIFVLYSSSEVNTYELVGDKNDAVLCTIDKFTGEQWYEKIFDSFNPETVDGNTCLYCHNINMVDVSDNEVVVTAGCVNDDKFLFINKTYDATTKTISAVEKSTIAYGDNSYDLNLRNYIQMANSEYSLSIEESDKVANSEDIWNPSKYDDNGTTKYIALFSFKTSSADQTPYIMMTSTDAKEWSPLFLLSNELKPGESSAIVVDNKIYLTNRIGGSQSQDNAHGQFYGVCDMSGNMLKSWTKMNIQRTRPCEVAIGNTVYIVYNDGNNSGKYWGRTKVVIAKVNNDYTLTEIKSLFSPYGIHYQSACNHNGAILMAYCEDVRGINGMNGNNAVNDIAIAQFYDFN